MDAEDRMPRPGPATRAGTAFAFLDGVQARVGAQRWVVAVRDGEAWHTRSPEPSLRDRVLLHLLNRPAAVLPEQPALVPAGVLGDLGARLEVAGVERLLVIPCGANGWLFFECPDDEAAQDFLAADARLLATMDMPAWVRAHQLANELVALAQWADTFDELAAGGLDPAEARDRLERAVRALDPLHADDAEAGAPPLALTPHCVVVVERLLALRSGPPASEGDVLAHVLLQERARIASVIHEGIAQVLTNVAIQLDVLHHALDDRPTAEAMLATSRAAVLDALDSLRMAIYDLTPAVESPADLTKGLRAFTADFSAQWGVDVALEATGTTREVAPEHVSLAFAFVQEMLTNVRKHAGTDQATVRLRAEPDCLVLEVDDRGDGITQEHSQHGLRLHQGLSIMRSRVLLAGGQMDIESSHGGGTTVRMQVPT